MKKGVLFILAPFFISACSLGPNYQRPSVDVSTDWRWKKAEPGDTSEKGPWWEIFDDPKLNELETLAQKNNQDLKAAIARIDEARSTARISRADLFPALTANPSWQRYRTAAQPDPYFIPASTANNYSVPFDLSYEVDLWGKVRRGFESAQQTTLATVAAYRNVLFTLQSDVAIYYFEIRSYDQQIVILNESVKLRTDALKIAQDRVAAGADNQLQVRQTEIEIATARATLATAQLQRATYQNHLAVLCGVATGKFEIPFSPGLPKVPVVSPGLPSELLERRPDIAEAERTLAARNAEIGVAYTAFFPTLRLTASGGYQSAELKDLFNWENSVWSFGPSISLPIFSGGRNAAGLEKAKAAYEEAVAKYRQSVLVAFEDVDNALAGFRFLDERATALHEGVTAARQSSEIAMTRYKNGAVNYLDVIDAERSRLDDELLDIQNEAERIINTIDLIKAIGGGWVAPQERKEPNPDTFYGPPAP